MPLYGFTKDVALTLKRVAMERQSKPQNRNPPMGVAFDVMGAGNLSYHLPQRKLANLRGYVCVPAGTIPGAKRVRVPGSGGPGYTLRLGKGEAYLWKRDKDTGTGNDMVPQRDEAGEQVKVTVFNLCPSSISPAGAADEIDPQDPVLFVVQDMWGDLFIVEKCEGAGSSSLPSVSESVTSVSEASGSQSVASASQSVSEASASQSVSQPSVSTSISTSQPSVSTSISTSQPSVSYSTSVSGPSTSLSVSTSVSVSVPSVSASESVSVSVAPPSTSEACCDIDVVTDVTFDAVACTLSVTKQTISYAPCGGNGCPPVLSGS